MEISLKGPFNETEWGSRQQSSFLSSFAALELLRKTTCGASGLEMTITNSGGLSVELEEIEGKSHPGNRCKHQLEFEFVFLARNTQRFLGERKSTRKFSSSTPTTFMVCGLVYFQVKVEYCWWLGGIFPQTHTTTRSFPTTPNRAI